MLPVLWFACVACAQEQSAVRIDLRPAVVAHHEQVVLGEVADIHALDLDTIRRLVSLPLGTRARAGSESVVRREVLERWVRLRLGVPRADVFWGGAAEAVVRTPWDEVRAPDAQSKPDAPTAPRAKPLIARGDWVSLRFKSGAVELETRVQALQDGRIGDVVRVRGAGATEPVPARVLSIGHVEALL